MRRVEIKLHNKGVNGIEEVTERGSFHCWGFTFEEFENGAMQVSIGIVELENGTVKTVCPTRIKFIPDHEI